MIAAFAKGFLLGIPASIVFWGAWLINSIRDDEDEREDRDHPEY